MIKITQEQINMLVNIAGKNVAIITNKQTGEEKVYIVKSYILPSLNTGASYLRLVGKELTYHLDRIMWTRDAVESIDLKLDPIPLHNLILSDGLYGYAFFLNS